ncbi:hypothetical protein [Chryseolinea soli]|uniref:Uncharacterized protein n=1 Tax=Chryseolinea soli TaxID=2321403 RepID=A0A385SYI3_9BACT|nr:hypothetical protein [Chryseolinea soli]AYB33788.1 hypothetical protein D4L85_25830 [Chryseolinea soli]
MDLGIFNEFWDGVHPHHLPLLNLIDSGASNQWNLTISLQRLNAIVEKNPEQSVQEGVIALLAYHDWRSHLVACLVILRLPSSARSILLDHFWKRLSLGSWVCPQILVALSLVDRNFEMKAEKILHDGLAMYAQSLSVTDEQKSQGSSRASTPSERKTKAAIEFLLKNTLNDTPDSDSGGLIASRWKKRLLKLMELKSVAFYEIFISW